MKLNVSKILAGGLLALAVPLLSACYATVGTDGRTYFQPIGYGAVYGSGYTYDLSRGYGYRSATPYLGYRAAQGYTYYSSPRAIANYYTTIPATTSYTSYPVVSRKVVSIGDACIVAPKPKPQPTMNCK